MPDINPDDLPDRTSIRRDLKPAIAEYMAREKRTDFQEAVSSLLLHGLEKVRGDRPQTTTQAQG